MQGRSYSGEGDPFALQGHLYRGEGDLSTLQGHLCSGEGDLSVLQGHLHSREGDPDTLQGHSYKWRSSYRPYARPKAIESSRRTASHPGGGYMLTDELGEVISYLSSVTSKNRQLA